jgi:hypothetical protein
MKNLFAAGAAPRFVQNAEGRIKKNIARHAGHSLKSRRILNHPWEFLYKNQRAMTSRPTFGPALFLWKKLTIYVIVLI